MTWPTVALGEVARVVSGATPKTGVDSYWDGEIAWATPADLSRLEGAYIGDTPRRLTDEGLNSCAATELPPGSVLLSSRAPIGHVAINTVPMATNQGFKSLVPSERLDAKYLYHWLCANRKQLEGLGNGATFKELSKKTVESVTLPVPPLDEQRRIAAILDQADAIRAMRRDVLTRLDLLISAQIDVLLAAVKGHAEVALGDVAEMRAGRNLVADDLAIKSDYRVLKISSVTSGVFRASESKPLPQGYVPPRDHLVNEGDVLMSRANTTELVGACALVLSVEPNVALPDKIWRFEWHDSRSDPVFYQALLSTAMVRRQISRAASGTGGSMKSISKESLKKVRLPLVDFESQKSFGEVARFIRDERRRVTEAMTMDEALFASLQARAFKGDL